MDFRNVYGVTAGGKAVKYILDSKGRRLWGAEEDFTIGTKLINMWSAHGSDWGWGEHSYTLKEDVTVVGRYGDPGNYGSGSIYIKDASGNTILNYNDGEGNRKSLIYRCKRGMTLYGYGHGSDGGVACWNILGNHHVIVKSTSGAILNENTLYDEGNKYVVYMSNGTTKLGSFYYTVNGSGWTVIK